MMCAFAVMLEIEHSLSGLLARFSDVVIMSKVSSVLAQTFFR